MLLLRAVGGAGIDFIFISTQLLHAVAEPSSRMTGHLVLGKAPLVWLLLCALIHTHSHSIFRKNSWNQAASPSCCWSFAVATELQSVSQSRMSSRPAGTGCHQSRWQPGVCSRPLLWVWLRAPPWFCVCRAGGGPCGGGGWEP